MKTTEKYLSSKEQVRIQILRDEIEMLNKKISRIVNRREQLQQEITKILTRVEENE